MMLDAELCSLCELYALDGLEAVEKADFETHLNDCAKCQAELPHWREVHDAMLYDFEWMEPPTGMRDRVLNHIFSPENVTDAPTIGGSVVSDTVQSVPMATEHREVENRIRPVPLHRQRRQRSRIAPWLTATAAAIVVSVGVSWWSVERPQGPAGQVVSTVALAATLPNSSAKMWVTKTSDGNHLMYIRFTGLKPLVGSQRYQVWLMKKGGTSPLSCGVFTPTAEGTQVFSYIMPDSAAYTIVGVTLEPKTDDQAPLGSKMFIGNLNA